ncbi:hypothetical protein ACIHFC_32280 [Streptomyces sp. NPDC052013]
MSEQSQAPCEPTPRNEGARRWSRIPALAAETIRIVLHAVAIAVTILDH